MKTIKELRSIQKFRMITIWLACIIPLEIISLSTWDFLGIRERVIFIGIALLFGREIFQKGIKSLLLLRFSDINLLMVIAIIGAVYLNQIPEAMIIIILFSLWETLEDYWVMKSKQALENLANSMPKTAFIKDIWSVSVEEVQIWAIVIVKPWEQIPIDWVITFWESLIDEATITWEPLPKSRTIDDNVFSGTLNMNGYLEIKTLKAGKDSTLAKIIDITYNSSQKKASSQRFIEKFSRYYTPSVILVSVLLVIIPVIVFGWDFNHRLSQALTLLIISCPCALVLSTPVAVFSAIWNATSHWIVIKWAKYLEEIWKIKAIAMDKTRTLTKWEPTISDIIPLNNGDENTLLACIWGMEQYSEHPIAKCIVEEAKKRGIKLHEHTKFSAVWGKWITSECMICNDAHRCLGSLSFIVEEHTIPQDIVDKVHTLEKEGKTIILVSSNKEPIGIIGLIDAMRPESYQTVKALKGLWVDIVMLTWDHQNAGSIVAKKLWIIKSIWWLLPDGKASEIEKLLLEYNHVAMLWDWVNDAPALAVSSVGIAMGAVWSDLAIENANIALMNDNIQLIPYLIQLSKKCYRIIAFNTTLAIIVKLWALILAVVWISSLWLAIVADVGVTLFVVVNSLRLFWTNQKAILSLEDNKVAKKHACEHC